MRAMQGFARYARIPKLLFSRFNIFLKNSDADKTSDGDRPTEEAPTQESEEPAEVVDVPTFAERIRR